MIQIQRRHTYRRSVSSGSLVNDLGGHILEGTCGKRKTFHFSFFLLAEPIIHINTHTVNVDIFALYIFSRHSRLSNVRENMYIVKITFLMLHRGNNVKNAKINPREIANFRKFAKMYTRENIYIHSIYFLIRLIPPWSISFYIRL